MALHSPVGWAPGGPRLGGPTAGGLPGRRRRRRAGGDEAADVPPDRQQRGEDVLQDGPEAPSLGLAHCVGHPAGLLQGGGWGGGRDTACSLLGRAGPFGEINLNLIILTNIVI